MQLQSLRTSLERGFPYLLFAVPVALVLSKLACNIVLAGLLLGSILALWPGVMPRAPKLGRVDYLWLLALALPSVIGVLQTQFIEPRLSLRDIDDSSNYLYAIPIYLAMRRVRIDVRPALAAGLPCLLISIAMFVHHIFILHIERDIAPNGFLGTIPEASISVILGALSLFLFIPTLRSPRSRWATAAVIAMILAIPFASVTRTAFVIITVLALFFGCLWPNWRLRTRYYATCILTAGLAFGLAHSGLWTRTDETIGEIAHYEKTREFQNTSTTTRLELWRMAVHMFADHPLLGVGRHQYRVQLEQLKAAGVAPSTLPIFPHAHNEFLYYASEQGLIGVASYLLLMGLPLAVAWRRFQVGDPAPRPATLLMVLTLGFLTAGMTDVILAWKWTLRFYSIFASVLLAATLMDDQQKPSSDDAN